MIEVEINFTGKYTVKMEESLAILAYGSSDPKDVLREELSFLSDDGQDMGDYFFTQLDCMDDMEMTFTGKVI